MAAKYDPTKSKPRVSYWDRPRASHWKMRHGDYIAIRDMGPRHLRNTIAMVRRNWNLDRYRMSWVPAPVGLQGEQAQLDADIEWERECNRRSAATSIADYPEFIGLVREHTERLIQARRSIQGDSPVSNRPTDAEMFARVTFTKYTQPFEVNTSDRRLFVESLMSMLDRNVVVRASSEEDPGWVTILLPYGLNTPRQGKRLEVSQRTYKWQDDARLLDEQEPRWVRRLRRILADGVPGYVAFKPDRAVKRGGVQS
jgi:hypothetical protein